LYAAAVIVAGDETTSTRQEEKSQLVDEVAKHPLQPPSSSRTARLPNDPDRSNTPPLPPQKQAEGIPRNR
jgi:hypothetical protein